MSSIFFDPVPSTGRPSRSTLRRTGAVPGALGSALALLLAAPAAAASPPIAGAESDPLDIFFDRAAGEPVARDSELGSLAVGVEAQIRISSQGASSFGAFAFAQVPFDRLAKPHAGPAASRAGAAMIAMGPQGSPASPRASEDAASAPAPSAPAPAAPAARPVVVTSDLARGAVRAACKAAKLDEAEARLDALASRARSSALLPELRLRATRAIDESESVAPTEYDPLRRTASGGTSTWLEARATFRLDRLVFADDEIAVERMRAARAAERMRLVSRVLELLDAWQRARTTEQDPAAKPDAQVRAILAAAASLSALDVLTDGWFSKALAKEAATQKKGDVAAPAPASPEPRADASHDTPRAARSDAAPPAESLP